MSNRDLAPDEASRVRAAVLITAEQEEWRGVGDGGRTLRRPKLNGHLAGERRGAQPTQ